MLVLVVAAALEVGGDAALRIGLIRSATGWQLLGGAMLLAYGVVVNANRAIDFGRLMGAYIAVFFIVSQIVSTVLLGERPTASLLVGGALIAAGGLVVQLGIP